MPDDTLPASLQESLLALLAFDARFGAAVASQVRPEHFAQPYQEIVTKLLSYRRQHRRPPGTAHLDDLFGWVLERGEKAARLRRLLTGITELSEGLNAEYVASRTQEFIRKQTLITALMKAGEIIQAGADDATDQVEQTLFTALRQRSENLNAGTFLGDVTRGLRFLDRKSLDYPLGIPELDEINLGMTAKELLLYIAPKGSGKSFFCVHAGRQGLIHRAKVLHITLEMREELVEARYYQSLFGAAWRGTPYARSEFEYDELHRLVDIRTTTVRPKLVFTDPNARKILTNKLKRWRGRLGSVLIKEFPTGSLTIPQLAAYMDYLEAEHGFVPHILAVDYPDLMRLDSRNYRIDLGRTFIGLRGLAVERNMALVCPTQGNRASLGAKYVRSNMVSEDKTKIDTGDNVLTYSQTEAEKRLGLARIGVGHARNTGDGREVVIAQSYATGQYVLSSALMQRTYWEKMDLSSEDGAGDDDEE